MQMSISLQEVEYVAKLSKLQITEEEKPRCAAALSAIVDYMQQLQEVDISQVAPTTHVLPLENIFRKDELIPCLPREQALALAPESADGFFKVPSIL
jgi:aspartyl-tRNA(Asn)/glutamyl-tRNA(Gln) amidotransferase subunit C